MHCIKTLHNLQNLRFLLHFLQFLPLVGLSLVLDEDLVRGGGDVDTKLKRGAERGRAVRKARRAKSRTGGARGTRGGGEAIRERSKGGRAGAHAARGRANGQE